MIETFTKNSVIIREGSKGTTGYIVNTGKVEVSVLKDGKKCVLAVLGKGQIFGEMGLIEDKPRSATVIALENTTLVKIQRKTFADNFSKNPAVILPIVRTLLERLRTASKMVNTTCKKCSLKLQQSGDDKEVEPTTSHSAKKVTLTQKEEDNIHVTLKGLNTISNNELHGKPMEIKEFPFRVGRITPKDGEIDKDVLANNHFCIREENVPYYVSENHFLIDKVDGSIVVVDRGSRNGLYLNGKHIKDSCILDMEDNQLIVGSAYSPFVFDINVKYPADIETKKGEDKPQEDEQMPSYEVIK